MSNLTILGHKYENISSATLFFTSTKKSPVQKQKLIFHPTNYDFLVIHSGTKNYSVVVSTPLYGSQKFSNDVIYKSDKQTTMNCVFNDSETLKNPLGVSLNKVELFSNGFSMSAKSFEVHLANFMDKTVGIFVDYCRTNYDYAS